MKPSISQSRFLKLALAMDFAKGEDYTAAWMTKLTSTGTVMLESFPRGMGKSWSMHNIMHWPYTPQRSSRKRHHKAKAQPNRGPRGNNPW